MKIKITLEEHARWQAERTMELRGMEVPEAFEGPVFENAIGCRMEGDFFTVVLADGTAYSYHKENIARIARYEGENNGIEAESTT